MTTYCKFLWQ